MRGLVTSDWHMGDGTMADNFLGQDYKVLDFIEKINPDLLVLAGDIFELWQCKMKDIKHAHYPIVNYIDSKYSKLSRPEIIRLKGNHDYTLTGQSKLEITTKSGKRILITHGFQNDPWMTSLISRFFTWCYGNVERLTAEQNIFSTSKRITNKAHEYAIKQLIKPDHYHIVILGHTHIIGIEDMCRKYIRHAVYANSGCCCDNKIQGIFFDTETDEIKEV